MKLGHLKWPQLVEMNWRQIVCLLPLGSFEQHGPHLPILTDTSLVSAIAEEVERSLGDQLLLLPTLWLGCSPHHHHWPGTISLDPSPYTDLVKAVCQSLVAWGARKIFLLNGHGGNELPVKVALRDLKTQYREMRDLQILLGTYWLLAWDAITAMRTADKKGFGHASESETSLMLHVAPDLVDLARARDDGIGSGALHPTLSEAITKGRVFAVNDFHEISESGVVGYARAASTQKGKQMFEGIVPEVIEFLRVFAEH